MRDSIFENMINVFFKSGDILRDREHFESCNYAITQKTTPFNLVTNAGLSIPDGHEKTDLVVKKNIPKISERNWKSYLMK